MSVKILLKLERNFFVVSIIFTVLLLIIDIIALQLLQKFLVSVVSKDWNAVSNNNILFLVFIYVVKTIYSYQFYKYLNLYLFKLIGKYSSKQINNLLSLPGKQFFSTSKEEKIKNVYNEVNQVVLQYLSNLISFTVELIILLGLLVFAGYKSLTIIVFLLILISIFYLLAKTLSNNELIEIGKKRYQLETNRLEMISQFFDGFDVLKSYRAHEMLLKRYEELATQVSAALAALKISQNIVRVILELTFVLTLVLVVLGDKAGVILLETDDFALLVGILIRLVPSATKIRQAINAIGYHKDTTKQFVKNLQNIHNEKVIEISPQQSAVLDQLSNINHNKLQCVLRGASGSGKTTLVEILVGNVVPSPPYPLETPENYYYGTQFIATFGQNFWENIDINKTHDAKGYERVNNLLRELKMEGLKEKSPQTYSGGELKILSLCRLLYLDPPTIFLDEPTTGLDFLLERRVETFLAKYLMEKNFIAIMHSIENQLLAEYQVISL